MSGDTLSARDSLFASVRGALRRSASHSLDEVAPRAASPMQISRSDRNGLTPLFVKNFEQLGGRVFLVKNKAAVVSTLYPLLEGKRAVASSSPYLEACGLPALRQVRAGITDPAALREACATADIGITSVAYALAETATLVMLAGPDEPRLVSLLPPVHIAVFPSSRILAGLHELLSAVPNPAGESSSMVLITGPSRTADIEQILVRGVHGPGDLFAVIVEE